MPRQSSPASESNRAIGVEYLNGRNVYLAHSEPSAYVGDGRTAYATCNVIFCVGSFNTPQLLMLSGIGPAEELRAHGITLRVELPGVGRNLQDRYEVPVVNRMNFPQWRVFRGARFAQDDPLFDQWQRLRQGAYITNGGVLAAFRRSFPERETPDIFCLPCWDSFVDTARTSCSFRNLNYLTWVVLKAHSNNRTGRVTLRSADPRDTPLINFHYFDEGSDSQMKTLQQR
jgi:choline dehydrogenase-like flavoprotein